MIRPVVLTFFSCCELNNQREDRKKRTSTTTVIRVSGSFWSMEITSTPTTSKLCTIFVRKRKSKRFNWIQLHLLCGIEWKLFNCIERSIPLQCIRYGCLFRRETNWRRSISYESIFIHRLRNVLFTFSQLSLRHWARAEINRLIDIEWVNPHNTNHFIHCQMGKYPFLQFCFLLLRLRTHFTWQKRLKFNWTSAHSNKMGSLRSHRSIFYGYNKRRTEIILALICVASLEFIRNHHRRRCGHHTQTQCDSILFFFRSAIAVTIVPLSKHRQIRSEKTSERVTRLNCRRRRWLMVWCCTFNT